MLELDRHRASPSPSRHVMVRHRGLDRSQRQMSARFRPRAQGSIRMNVPTPPVASSAAAGWQCPPTLPRPRSRAAEARMKDPARMPRTVAVGDITSHLPELQVAPAQQHRLARRSTRTTFRHRGSRGRPSGRSASAGDDPASARSRTRRGSRPRLGTERNPTRLVRALPMARHRDNVERSRSCPPSSCASGATSSRSGVRLANPRPGPNPPARLPVLPRIEVRTTATDEQVTGYRKTPSATDTRCSCWQRRPVSQINDPSPAARQTRSSSAPKLMTPPPGYWWQSIQGSVGSSSAADWPAPRE